MRATRPGGLHFHDTSNPLSPDWFICSSVCQETPLISPEPEGIL